MTRLRAKFDGKVLVPLEAVDLPQDRVLDVQVSEISTGTGIGSVEALLRAVQQPPHVERETVDEMERAIATAKRQPTYDGAFDEGA